MTKPEVNIAPSEWGFTATLANGIPIAHSQSKELLSEYIAECFAGERDMPVPERPRGIQSGSGDRNVGARNVSKADSSGTTPAVAVNGLALVKVSYNTRARTTGAMINTGKTADGTWATLCVSHGSATRATSGRDAEQKIKVIEEWCTGCAPIVLGLEPKIKKDALLEDLL